MLLYQREGLFVLNLPFSLAACYLLWFITRKIRKANVISWIGNNSLVLFASHRIILNWIYDPIIRYYNPDTTYCEYMLTGGVIILFAYVVLTLTLKKYFPKAMGV